MRYRQRHVACLIAALLGCALAGQTISQEQAPNTSPDAPAAPAVENGADPEVVPQPQPTLTVRDLVVLQTDRYGESANDAKTVRTTLFPPINHSGRAKRTGEDGPYENMPMPLGLITFEGKIEQPMRVRMDLVPEAAFFHAHWPNDARKGERVIDWFQLKEADDGQRPETIEQENHWLDPLRKSEDRLWLRTRDPIRKERFILYDASLAFAPALDIKLQDNAYIINRRQEDAVAPPLALLVSRTDQGFRADTLAGPWPEGQPPVIGYRDAQTVRVPKAQATMTPLAEYLTQLGYNATEVQTALSMVAMAGLQKNGMSLVYVLPEGEIDKYISLRFKPEPDKLVRTTIVVVNNVDPELGDKMDLLIAGLSSEDWLTRDKAQRDLQAIGQAAIRKVQSLRDSKDPEIAFRARQILDAYDLAQE